jgi:hypothetical protein
MASQGSAIEAKSDTVVAEILRLAVFVALDPPIAAGGQDTEAIITEALAAARVTGDPFAALLPVIEKAVNELLR